MPRYNQFYPKGNSLYGFVFNSVLSIGQAKVTQHLVERGEYTHWNKTVNQPHCQCKITKLKHCPLKQKDQKKCKNQSVCLYALIHWFCVFSTFTWLVRSTILFIYRLHTEWLPCNSKQPYAIVKYCCDQKSWAASSAGSCKYFFCSAKCKSATKIEFVCSASARSASVKRLLRNSPHPQIRNFK